MHRSNREERREAGKCEVYKGGILTEEVMSTQSGYDVKNLGRSSGGEKTIDIL